MSAFEATSQVFGIGFDLPHLSHAGALVHIGSDGKVLMNHGGAELAPSLNAKLAVSLAQPGKQARTAPRSRPLEGWGSRSAVR